MKKTLIFAVMLVVAALMAVPASAEVIDGFEVVITPSGSGTGSFSISGSNDQATVDIAGTWSAVFNKQTKEWDVLLTVQGEVIKADGTVVDVNDEFTYSGRAGVGNVIRSIIAWVRSIVEA